MCEMLLLQFNVVWSNKYVSNYWREGLIVSLLKQVDSEDPSNYKVITLLNW